MSRKDFISGSIPAFIGNGLGLQANEEAHTIVLSIINDLVRMQQNIDCMDEKAKGVPQLRNRIKSIFTTLQSHQYEVADLRGRSYHEGDNLLATFELNETIPVGTNRIKRVIKPQVSYQGKLIQVAEVVVEFHE